MTESYIIVHENKKKNIPMPFLFNTEKRAYEFIKERIGNTSDWRVIAGCVFEKGEEMYCIMKVKLIE